MSRKQEILDYTKSKFLKLLDEGYPKLKIIDDDWHTTSVYWVGEEVAVELEFGWRSDRVNLFIVKLEKGKLPSISQLCRANVAKLINENPMLFTGSDFNLEQYRKIYRDSESYEEKIDINYDLCLKYVIGNTLLSSDSISC